MAQKNPSKTIQIQGRRQRGALGAQAPPQFFMNFKKYRQFFPKVKSTV